MLDVFKSTVSSMRFKLLALCVSACAVMAISPLAMAEESSAEKAVKALGEKIGSEGIAIFLIIITSVTALLAVIVAVTLGIKKLKSFAK